jgi:hypothetical protein
MWRDRVPAGQELATALGRYRDVHPLVLGLPRGGVVVAAEIAPVLAGGPYLNDELVGLSDAEVVDILGWFG